MSAYDDYGFHWPRLEPGATVRWPFLLAAFLTFLITAVCLIADAEIASQVIL